MIDINTETLIISDDKLFLTIEGEGEHIGKPSVFMRMAMCNLRCPGFQSEASPNGCDSYISWSVKNKMTFAEIFEMLDTNKYIENLRSGAIFKFTGGEPIVQQKQLLKFVEAFVTKYKFLPIIDFETNATITPDDRWIKEFNATFTTSPKLKSNGDPEEKTYKVDTLRWHADNNSGFKFVVRDSQDLVEIWQKYIDDYEGINVPLQRVWLMPCCGSREEHIKLAPSIAEFAKQLNVNFSPRLHLLIWDKALRV